MNEADRKQRNYIKVHELHPAIRPRMEAILRELESYGFRPRIQEAWRSPRDQLAAYYTGKSKVKYGFHNVTAEDGTKEALAADVWDDDRPTSAKTHFMLHLLAAAEKNGLTTGIRWSLSDNRIRLIEDAVAKEDWKKPVWVGWDPLHVEVTGITIEEAEEGKRPEMSGSDEGTGATPQPPDGSNPPEPDDTTNEWKKYEPEPIQYRVENLETAHTKEYELKTALQPVTLLAVPYISQLGPGADSRHNDCGAAAAAMVLAAYTGNFITPDEFYEKFNIVGDPYLTEEHVRNALGSEGLPTHFKSDLEINDLFDYLKSDIPLIIPTNYNVLHEAGLTEDSFAGPHFSAVIGMDAKNIYVHDPLFTDPEDGDAHAYPMDIFIKAWTDTTLITDYAIPQRSAIIPTVPIGEQPEEQPVPVILKRVQVTTSRLNVRQGPGTNYRVVGTVLRDQEYNLNSEVDGWGEIQAGKWISLSYTKTISSLPSQTDQGGQNDKPQLDPGQGILFNINLATSIPQNPTGKRAAEYLFNDPLISSMHRNLCGDICLSMIYETATKKQNTLGFIHQGSKGTSRRTNGGTNAYQFAQQFSNTFPDGWKAHAYYLNYLYYFEAGNPRHLSESPGGVKKSLTANTPAEIKAMITNMLKDGAFVVAGASQSTLMEGPGAARLNPKGVGHWVVVAGVSENYVYINNSFMNRRETYTWDEFMESFGYWLVQIFPSSSYQPQVYSGSMSKAHANLEQDRNRI